MNRIADLIQILSTPQELVLEPEVKFKALAESLLKDFQIQKGDKLYWLTDIEFYIYTDEHRDIITYPRNTEAGEWFFHACGVDISFKSEVDPNMCPQKEKPELSKDSFFGGILNRGIVPVDELSRPIDGPMKVCDELFDKFDAFATPTNFPRIVEALAARKATVKHHPEGKRHGLKENEKEKVNSILYNYEKLKPDYLSKEDLEKEYKKYWNANYHFIAETAPSSVPSKSSN